MCEARILVAAAVAVAVVVAVAIWRRGGARQGYLVAPNLDLDAPGGRGSYYALEECGPAYAPAAGPAAGSAYAPSCASAGGCRGAPRLACGVSVECGAP